jgi:hypothetical protein
LPNVTEFSLIAARLLLAAVFLLAGTAKFADPLGSFRALRDFGLPTALARPMVVLLPLLELAVAVALIPVSVAWYGACGALGLLIVFLIAVGIAMLRGRKPDCHCFGQLHSEPAGWPTIARNIVLAACAGWLVRSGPVHPGPDLWTWLANLSTFESKVALVVGCLVGFLFLRVIHGASHASKAVEAQEPSEGLFSFLNDDDDETPAPAQPPVRRAAAAPIARPSPTPASQTAPAYPGPINIGLPVGTPAPLFELPALTGENRSLQSLLADGNDLLLIFSRPRCESCQAFFSNLPLWTRQLTQLPNVELPAMAVLSRGAVAENLAKLKDFEPSRILLQREFEIAAKYDCDTTPAAVLVGADGIVRSELALGALAIKQLLTSAAMRAAPKAENPAPSPIQSQ